MSDRLQAGERVPCPPCLGLLFQGLQEEGRGSSALSGHTGPFALALMPLLLSVLPPNRASRECQGLRERR